MTYVLTIMFVTSGIWRGVSITKFTTLKACEFIAKEVADQLTMAKTKCIAVDDSIKAQEIKHDTIGVGK